jgi:hypothetical protein
MGAFFTAASSQKLATPSVPIVTYPFTVGMWVNPSVALSGSSKAIWSISVDANNYFLVYWSNGLSALACQMTNATVSGACSSGLAPTVGRWNYVLARYISSTNRRCSAMSPDGTVSHGSDTTGGADPVGTMVETAFGSVASLLYWDGGIAEFFLWDGDIWPDGGAAPDWFIRQLAYRGPFSLPGRTRNIVEDKSLRGTLEAGRVGESWSGPKGRILWSNTNGVRLGPHPVLLGGYKTGPAMGILPPIPF